MTARHEPTDPDRIMKIARRVLDDYERRDDWNKPRSRSGREMPPYEVMFARATLELTAKVKRVEALAETLTQSAERERRSYIGGGGTIRGEERDSAAARIRTALNGDHA